MHSSRTKSFEICKNTFLRLYRYSLSRSFYQNLKKERKKQRETRWNRTDTAVVHSYLRSYQLVKSRPVFVHTKDWKRNERGQKKKERKKGRKKKEKEKKRTRSDRIPWDFLGKKGSNLHSDSVNRSVQNSVMKAWTALRPLRAIRTVMNGSGGAPVVLALLFPFKCKYGLYTNRTAAGLVICALECTEQREKGRME